MAQSRGYPVYPLEAYQARDPATEALYQSLGEKYGLNPGYLQATDWVATRGAGPGSLTGSLQIMRNNESPRQNYNGGYATPPQANYMYDAPGGQGSHANGAYQYQPGTFDTFKNAFKNGAEQYQHAYQAPSNIQDAVTGWGIGTPEGVRATGGFWPHWGKWWEKNGYSGPYPQVDYLDITPDELVGAGTDAGRARLEEMAKTLAEHKKKAEEAGHPDPGMFAVRAWRYGPNDMDSPAAVTFGRNVAGVYTDLYNRQQQAAAEPQPTPPQVAEAPPDDLQKLRGAGAPPGPSADLDYSMPPGAP